MTITLPVTERGNNKEGAAADTIQAVVYGPKQESIAITVDAKVFSKVLHDAGESTIVELTGLKKPIEVLIKEVAFHPVKREVTHVDFYAVEAGKEMTTSVALEFIGEAPVEQSRLGVVNKVLHEIEVTCKPSELPNHIDVDVSTLIEVDDKILVKDLQIPSGVKVETGEDDPVAVVSVAKEEQEEEVAEVDMEAIEVEKKGKEELDSEAAS